MKWKRIRESEEAACRLLGRIRKLRASRHSTPDSMEIGDGCVYGAECAAIKRASMDLTKALAKLRRP